MPTLSVSSYSYASITVAISGLENPSSQYDGFRFRRDGGSWASGTSTSHTFSGLSTGTDYDFDAQANWDGTWYAAGSCSGHTRVYAPSISYDSKGATWIQVVTVSNDTGGDITTYIDGVSVENSGYSYQRNGNYLLVGGLIPDTSYSFYCKFTKNGYSASSSTISVTTLKAQPSNFYWEVAKTAGGDFNIRATEWNSFTNKINQFRVYKGLSEASFTAAVAGNNFTATIFNQARNALNSLSSYFGSGHTIPSTKSAGDDIYASYFNDMRDAMNSIE